MVLAKKKAAGAEYAFDYQYSLPQNKKKRVIKKTIKPSPIFKTVVGILVISCFFITALAFTFVKARIACLNWEIKQIKQENVVIAKNIEKTKLDIAALKSLSRIKNLAVTELGMTENPEITYLVMNDVFAKESRNEENKMGNDVQSVPQLASGETKDSIFKVFCEAIALRDFMEKG